MIRRVIAWVHGVVTGEARRRAFLAPFAPLLFLIIVGCLMAAAFWVDRRFGLPAVLSSPWSFVIATPLAGLGVYLTASTILLFFKSQGTPSPLHPPPALLDTGLYAHLRNPMLLGEILMGFALGLLFQSFTLTLVATPLFALLFVVEIKLVEEPELEQRLGEPYREYRKRVPMFIPCRFNRT